MWKLALYILYATGLFASVSAGLNASPFQAPLNSCVLTVQSTVGKVANPQAIIGYGILNRFAMSNPPVNPLTVVGGGTSDVFDELGDGLYSVGFGVRSGEYEVGQLKNIVTQQWPNTNLFERDVGSAGNWKVIHANC